MISVADAAERMGVTTQAVYALADRGRIKSERPWPRHVLICPESLERYVAEHDAPRPVRQPAERLPSISLRKLRRLILDETGAGQTDELAPNTIRQYAYSFVAEHRPDWSEIHQQEWASDSTDALLAGRGR